jgi:arginyl-tRNA synthetase
MKHIIREMISQALQTAKRDGELTLEVLPDIVVEEPKDSQFGDFSTAVALSLAKSERKKPKDIAEKIKSRLQIGANVAEVETAGPGFINLKMSPGFYLERLRDAVRMGDAFGKSDMGRGEKVLLEFVSANPTGPLHVGHGRGAAVGDMLGRLLKKAGYDVTTEYYINDVGNQMNTLGRSTWLRYLEIYGKAVDFPQDHYRGEYIKDVALKVKDSHGDAFVGKSDEEILPFFRKFSSDAILAGIEKDLSDFRVVYDRWFSEQTLFQDHAVDKAVDWLRERDFVYDREGAVWLKSSAFKDDKDRVIIRQNGEKTYFCSDIAYHRNKIDRGFKRIINVWGADHHGYVPRMEAVVEALGFDLKKFSVLLVQFVTLVRGGEKVSMSTRSGDFITLEEVVKEVGVDAARFFFLMRSCDTHLDFDLELARKETPENPVFYIQYAHARICSVFLTAAQKGIALPSCDAADLSLLDKKEEIDLIKKILGFAETVEKSALALDVHRIPHYLHDLVAAFHSYYAKHRVVEEENPRLSGARLFLLQGLRTVIKAGLAILGVSSPEKM